MRSSTKNSSILSRQDANNLWGQPSMFAIGQSNLLRTPSSQSIMLTGNPPGTRSNFSMKNVSAYNQTMSQVNAPSVTSRSMMPNNCRTNNVQKQMPMQYALNPRGYVNIFPSQVYPSSPQMQTGHHEHFGNRIIFQQSPQSPYQERVNIIPVPSTMLASSGIMKQSSLVNVPQAKSGLSRSTTTFSTRLNNMNLSVDTISQVRMQESNSEQRSLVSEVNSPCIFSSGLSTPIPSYLSPSYINSPSHIGTPVMLCTSPSYVSPTQINNGFPTVGASLDIPPAFELNNQNSGVKYPSQVSCNISHAPVPSFHKSYQRNELQRARVDSESRIVQKAASDGHPGLPHQGKSNDQARKEETAEEILEDDKDIWNGSCAYKEYKKDGGSNLFITYAGSKSHLVAKLRKHNLKVRLCRTTNDMKIFNVIFEDHANARKAFTTQREIHLKMVPPKPSSRNWFKSPSPNFLVKYETKFRLTVRSGKAASHEIVGEFLMSNFDENKGCYIWADQLKGHRIRVVGCHGNFKLPNGRVVQLKSLPCMTGYNLKMGWVSYRCKHTREDFVIRRSGHNVRDYIYNS